MKKSCVYRFVKNALAGVGAALVCAAFFSCSNFSGGADSSNRISYPTVRFVANMQIDAAAAMPQQISALKQGGLASGGAEVSRSAAPGLDIGEASTFSMEYFATATPDGHEDQAVTVTGYTSTLELSLTSGHTWKIVCGVRDKTAVDAQGDKLVYLSAETTQPVTADEPVISHNFVLLPGTSGSGKLYLEMYADDDSGVDKTSSGIDLVLPSSWDTLSTVCGYDDSGKWVLQTTSGKTIPSGTYEIQI
ncbi:MAG: hypothetical protein J5700_00465, partial [Treponema sp.]|nr:hypothetical protein [Treponema sp.]